MEKNGVWRRIGSFLLNVFEVYVPTVTFTIMFSVFVLQIFFRYVLNSPLIWPFEITLFGFIWTAVLGACYAKRENSHVVFSLVYDKRSPKGQLIFRLIGEILILAAFCIALYPTYDFVQFMKIDKSTALQIPFNIAYFPYVIFLILIIGRVAYDLVRDMKKLVRGEV